MVYSPMHANGHSLEQESGFPQVTSHWKVDHPVHGINHGLIVQRSEAGFRPLLVQNRELP